MAIYASSIYDLYDHICLVKYMAMYALSYIYIHIYMAMHMAIHAGVELDALNRRGAGILQVLSVLCLFLFFTTKVSTDHLQKLYDTDAVQVWRTYDIRIGSLQQIWLQRF